MEEVWNHQDSSYSWPPGQTEKSWKKDLGQGGEQEPDCGDGRTRRTTIQHSTNQAFMVRWPDGSHSSVKGTRHPKRHLKVLDHEKQDSDATNIELFGLNAKCHVWRKLGTNLTVKYGGGSIMLWGCFSVAGTGRLVSVV
uniref:Uncharacterized protein n=1 Tax=Oncorhynchus tshawytscha TaxID=74940 RepID=A0AAZ3S1U4_ONCTS